MKTLITFAHHGFSCGCRSVDVNLGDISPVELANILKAARGMQGESIKMAAGEEEISKLKYKQLGETNFESVKQQLGVGKDEVIVAAVDAPEIFKLKGGESIYADDRVFFVFNPKTGQIRPRGFTPFTDMSASNQAQGQDVGKAMEEASKFAVSKLRALYKVEGLRQKLAKEGINAKVRLQEDSDGGHYVLDADADAQGIANVEAAFDADNIN